MPWDEVISGRSERPHQGEPFEHLLDIDDNGKGSLLLQVGVLVAGVGGENDEAAPRTDANDLEPPGMDSGKMHCHALSPSPVYRTLPAYTRRTIAVTSSRVAG